MPDTPIPIPSLPAAGSLTGSEDVPIDQAGVTSRTTTQAIANLAATGGLTAPPELVQSYMDAANSPSFPGGWSIDGGTGQVPQAGNLLLAIGSAQETSQPTLSAGSTWTLLGNLSVPNLNGAAAVFFVYYKFAAGGGSSTDTIEFATGGGSNTFWTLWLFEIAGAGAPADFASLDNSTGSYEYANRSPAIAAPASSLVVALVAAGQNTSNQAGLTNVNYNDGIFSQCNQYGSGQFNSHVFVARLFRAGTKTFAFPSIGDEGSGAVALYVPHA